MTVGALAWPGFVAGALVSLSASFVLVTRLERVGERLGLSEGLLGLVAALAADAPEVSVAVTAVAHDQQRVGAGVVIGSNVFNLAALLGLSAVVAGWVGLHRKVVVLGGSVALWVAGVCLVVVLGVLVPPAGLVLALVVVALYALALAPGGAGLSRLRLPERWAAWLRSAVSEEESDLESAIRPRRGRPGDAVVAGVALIVVIVASVVMERAASVLGSRFAVPEIVVGGLVLAAVTSLPNAVAAVYLAARGRGAATLSTALNSNTLNVVAGLLIPAAVIGLGGSSAQGVLVTVWYAAFTLAVLAFAYRGSGLGRGTGFLILAAYAAFTASVLVSGYAGSHSSALVIVLGAVTVVVLAGALAFGRHAVRAGPADGPRPELPGSIDGQISGGSSLSSDDGHRSENSDRPAAVRRDAVMKAESLLAGWSVGRVWLLGLALSLLIATADAILGHRVVLIGLLTAGPCCALLTGRWVPTGITALWALGLAVVLGYPDGIWGSATHLTYLAAVAVVAAANTVAALVIGHSRAGRRT